MSKLVNVEQDGAIARIILNRPAAFNALNAEMRRALRDAVADVEGRDAARVVILSGAGRGFCAGADVTEQPDAPVHLILDAEYRPIFTGIAASSKIWIAQVHGSAAGIGGAIAMACDLMTMDADATIYMAFAAIGLVPDGGACWQLLRALGYRHALQTILEGRKITAAEAVDHGLANLAAADGTLDAETTALAKRLASGAPLAAAAAKRLLRQMDRLSFDEAFSREAVEQSRLAISADAAEGVAAFMARRKPSFTGE
ncbi:MAG: enoyl-CoA hydratase/isomerase family protein [Rhizobiaceae bacterium]|nr:enoyl-CoA hydratase/isomerase family protein [Rhizobiaceae bacterium]